VTIRPARLTDLPAVARIEAETFGEDVYPAFFFRQALDAWGALLVIAEVREVVAGYALAVPSLAPNQAWLLSTAVSAEARGRGVGRALVESVLDRLDAAGRRTVRLTVSPDNAVAVRLYERLGFAVEARETDYFGPGAARLVMRR
jgi:ribosomal-protein-alanine N-acetyltransferase